MKTIPLESKPQLASAENTFCLAPWKSLVIEPDGAIKPCCAYDKALGRYQTPGDLKRAWKGEALQKLRQELASNIQHKNCKTCFRAEEEGRVSKRMKLNRLAELPSGPDNTQPVAFEICFSNSCNLTCVMCDSLFSHLWTHLEKDLPTVLKRPTHDKFQISEKDLAELLEYTSNALDIEILGGEPSINPIALKFIDQILERKKTLRITLTTNLVKLSPQFLKMAKKHKRLSINVSLDGTGKIYEYTRGFDFEEVERNLDNLLKNMANNSLLIHHTTSILNVHNIPEFCSWLQEIGHKHPQKKIKPRFDQIVSSPQYLQPCLLSVHDKEKLIQQFEKINQAYPYLENLIHYLKQPPPTSQNTEELIDQLQAFISFMNLKRGFKVPYRTWNLLLPATGC